MTRTALDKAHAAMLARPDDAKLRMRFYDRLAEAELYVLLEAEAEGSGPILPRVFPVEGTPVVVAFDLAERLSEFAGSAVPCAILSGRELAPMLAGQGGGLGLNLGTPSGILLPAAALDWLAATLAKPPEAITDRPRHLGPPRTLPPVLLAALHDKLATTAGLSPEAWLAEARYNDGAPRLLLAFVDARPGAETALAQAVAEALKFSGLEDGALDVAFFEASEPACRRLARAGVRIDLPEPVPAAPVRDPAKPPRLK